MLASPALADKAVISNHELMDKLAAEVARELMNSVSSDIGMGHVTLVPQEKGQHYDFVNHVFTRILTWTGHKVYSPGAQKGGEGSMLRFEYWVLDFDLSYPKIYRSYLIGGKKVKRSADVKLLAKLIDPSDESVAWIGEASRSHEDQFAYKLLPDVEAGMFAFTKPPRTTTKWGKLVEPVVVGGILVGLIYLFFSNQNDS